MKHDLPFAYNSEHNIFFASSSNQDQYVWSKILQIYIL